MGALLSLHRSPLLPEVGLLLGMLPFLALGKTFLLPIMLPINLTSRGLLNFQ